MYTETEKLWRQRRRAEGYCGQCWGRKANVGPGATKSLCGKCANRMRAWKAEKITAGICRHCLKTPVDNAPGATKRLCAKCAEFSRRRSRGDFEHTESAARVERLMALAAVL